MRKTDPGSNMELCFCRSFIERLEKVDIFDNAPGVSALASSADAAGGDIVVLRHEDKKYPVRERSGRHRASG